MRFHPGEHIIGSFAEVLGLGVVFGAFILGAAGVKKILGGEKSEKPETKKHG
jgi:hypothetical protein